MTRHRLEDEPLLRALRLLELRPRTFVVAVLTGAGALGSAVALAAVSAWLIARASQMPPVLHLTVAAVAVRTFGISRGVLRYLERLVSHDLALRGMATLRTRAYERLAAGDPARLLRLRRGDLLARLGEDVDVVGDLVVRGLLPAAVAATVGAGSVVLLGVLLPPAGLLLAGCLLLAGVVAPWWTARSARLTEERTSAARAELASCVMTALDGADELLVAGRAGALAEQAAEAQSALAREADRAARPASAALALQHLATGAAVVGSLLLGAHALAAGRLDPVVLAVVVLTPLTVLEVTATLPGAAVQVWRSRQAAVRVLDLLDGAGAPAGAPLAGPDEAPGRSPGRAPDTGTGLPLVARGLVCGYAGSDLRIGPVDLDLGPGRRVAVVGPSGCGKTTLLLTLAGIMPPAAGTVRVGGREAGRLTRAEVARHVTLTTEDAHVFDTSLLENLRVARGDVTEAEAASALRSAGLGDWLAALPDGVHTVVGADAARMSGGQRRAVLLARALLGTAPVLLVDEPTEHLDERGDALQRALLDGSLVADRGVLLVTHRRHGLEAADEVIEIGPDGSVRARDRAPGELDESDVPGRTTVAAAD